MDNRFTEIAFILDRSGSMGPIAAEAIEGFNFFLHEQQHGQGHARLTLVLFDDEYLVPVQSLPVDELVPLDPETYIPRNSTALLDAIGQTIDDLGARLAALPEPVRPGKVIVAILTDGQENASRRYTWRAVSDSIKHQAEKYAWEFLFLGANQDAIATAAQLSISAANAATYRADGIGYRSSTASISRKTSALRAQAAGVANAEETQAAAAPMQDLLEEEDRKRRSNP